MQIDLEVRGLSKILSHRTLFSDVSFRVQNGECWQIAGENGAGKTTLLKIITGLLVPDAGDILWQGRVIAEQRADYHAALGYVSHRLGLRDELTVLENIALGFREITIFISEQEKILEAVQLFALRNTAVKQLSQGQRQRVAWARLLCSGAALWILDEPFSALDVKGMALLQQVIETHVSQGGSVVLTTHRALSLASCNVQVVQL